jgi:hypothetical protein
MTVESGADGSVDLGGTTTGADGQNQNDGDNSSAPNGNGNGGDFLSALDADNRQYFEKKGWKDVNAAVKSYRDLEKAHSQRAPQNNNSNNNQPTLPTSPAGYEFKLPDGIPQEGFYDKEFAETFKGVAHKAKLLPEQAQALHDFYVTQAFDAHTKAGQSSTAALNKKIADTHADLTKTWGDTKSPAFARNVEMAKRAMANLDPELKTALKSAGVLVDQGGKEVVTNSVIFRALAKAGSSMFAEDATYDTNLSVADNPFDPKNASPAAMTRQSELIKKDPELARTLIRAAKQEGMWQFFLNKK